jgi:transcriptional regulator with PAS, ATPase and Fis domain
MKAVLHHDTASLASTTLSSMFTDKQPSFGYRTCFQTKVDNHTTASHNIYVFVFPNGIHLSNSDYSVIASSLSSSYSVPIAITNGHPIISSYTFNGSRIQVNGTSEQKLYTAQVSTSSDDFQHKFEYFTNSVTIVGSKRQAKHYTTSQYKCVPFNREENLLFRKGQIYVTPGQNNESLQTVLDNNDIEKTREEYNVAQANAAGDNASKVIGGILCALAFGGIVYTMHSISKD